MQADAANADPEPLLSARFAALADPLRRRFVQRLVSGEATVTELAGLVDVTLPAVSRHLRKLERAGLVVREKRGRVTWCRLRADGLDEPLDWLARTRDQWDGRLDRLERFVTEEE